MRHFGVSARGLRLGVIRQGDDLSALIFNSLIEAMTDEGITPKDGDILGITESVLARSQGNYASLEALAKDVRNKTGGETIGVVFPIMSRNRFLGILRAISAGAKRVIIVLSYPQDEVGNALFDPKLIDDLDINPTYEAFTESELRQIVKAPFIHPFTGIDYPHLYKTVSDNIDIIFSNRPEAILDYTDIVITADIHTRFRTKKRLLDKGAKIVIGLDELLNESVDGSGYNATYGVLGSNFAKDGVLKLFPRDGQQFVEQLQTKLSQHYHKRIEVLVYGDGAFKDPVGHIWELADPVVAPFYTSGLSGVPQEAKFKYLSDTKFAHLSSNEANEAMRQYIKEFKQQTISAQEALGTTPRRITDLVGSLCDLMTGSGDKGTPVVYIQGYFDKYDDE